MGQLSQAGGVGLGSWVEKCKWAREQGRGTGLGCTRSPCHPIQGPLYKQQPGCVGQEGKA